MYRRLWLPAGTAVNKDWQGAGGAVSCEINAINCWTLFFFFALFRSNCWYWFLSPFYLCITHMFVTWLSFNRNDLFQQCDVPELCRCCLEVAHKSSHLWLNTHNIYMCVYVYMYTDINIYKYICTKNNFEFTRWWISCIYASFVGYFANQQPSLRRLHVFKET